MNTTIAAAIWGLALSLALADGKFKSLRDRAKTYHPSLGVPPAANAKTGYLEKTTLFHLATHTAGFEKPGGFRKLIFAPGTKWCYGDGGPNWLAECVTLACGVNLKELLFRRIFTPPGITPKDLTWRRNWYRPAKINGIPRREFGSGISANVDAMARIGLLYLRRGRWCGKQLLPEEFVAAVGKTPRAVKGLPVVGRIGSEPRASNHYGLLWWNNSDGAVPGVPRDAFWSWGLYDSFIIVIPSLDIVVARAGESWKRARTDYDKLALFLGPIVAAVKKSPRPARAVGGGARKAGVGPAGKGRTRSTLRATRGAPYPPSEVITAITWAPAASVTRKATGSDNWPITWADDDALYTAYGDGWGFVPKVERKLSLGLARVMGDPPGLKGLNIRSSSGEQIGDGPLPLRAAARLVGV